MAAICVVGGGPAGSTFAARMAQLGHEVVLIERARFPRSHLGESLSPGVLPLLETTGAREAVEAAGFSRVRRVHVKWAEGHQVREDPREQGLLVERGAFDRCLLDRAKALGVRVLQPASVRKRSHENDGWRLTVECEGSTSDLDAAFIADATGRSAGINGQKRRTRCRTLALYAYWRGSNLPVEPRIEAGEDAWYWGVPLPDGTYNTLAFVDVKAFRAEASGSLEKRFLDLLQRSQLMDALRDASMIGPVLATDATPYLDHDCVTASSIKIGEAALAIDPISSSGVQKAIQSALAGATVANTLLRKPESRDAALAFYRQNLADASERHCRWAASHYASVAMPSTGSFWHDRASGAESSGPNPPSHSPVDPRSLAGTRVQLSRALEFVDLPCIEGDYVAVKPAVRHPALEGPVAYLGGWALAPLLQHLPADATPVEIARAWSARMPMSSGLAIMGWLLNNGILVGASRAEHTVR